MALKESSMMFMLNATLNGGFKSTMNQAQQEFTKLQNEIKQVQAVQKDISAYQRQEQAVQKTEQRLAGLNEKEAALAKQMEAVKSESALLASQLEAAKNSETQNADAIAKMEREAAKLNTQSATLERQETALKQQIDNTTGTLQSQQDKLQGTAEKLRAAGVDTDNLAAKDAELTAKVKELKEQQQAAADKAKEMGERAQDSFEAASAALTSSGLIEGVESVTNAFKECVSIAAEFESTMSTVEALSGATADEMTALSTAAKDVGATTSFTATEAAESLTYMGMAGWNASEMLNGMNGIVNLSLASGEDLAQTSDIVTDSLTAFGLSAADSAHFADVLAATATNSNTNVAMMGETFKYCAPLAKSFWLTVWKQAA